MRTKNQPRFFVTHKHTVYKRHNSRAQFWQFFRKSIHCKMLHTEHRINCETSKHIAMLNH